MRFACPPRWRNGEHGYAFEHTSLPKLGVWARYISSIDLGLNHVFEIVYPRQDRSRRNSQPNDSFGRVRKYVRCQRPIAKVVRLSYGSRSRWYRYDDDRLCLD